MIVSVFYSQRFYETLQSQKKKNTLFLTYNLQTQQFRISYRVMQFINLL